MIVVFKEKNMNVMHVESRIIWDELCTSRDNHVARNSRVKGNTGRDRVTSLSRRVIHREFRGVSEFFCAPPAEASSLELDTALAGVVCTDGNGLGCSITAMPLFPSGATKASSDELTCIALVGRVVPPSTPVGAFIRETLEVPDAPVSIASDTTNVAGVWNTLTAVAAAVFNFPNSTPAW